MKQSELERLRNSLTAVDLRIVDLINERQNIVDQIGRFKRSKGRTLRDFEREKVVIDAALDRALEIGLDTRLAEDVIRTLIRYSLENQEKGLISASERGSGKTALIIGGAGRMGQWFAGLLTAQSFAVELADPCLNPGPGQFREWKDAGTDYDVIVVATPIRETNRVLTELASLQPTGLVFDISSLKTPLRAGIQALVEAGCKVASLHPMFGADTELLSRHHLVFVETGCAQANEEAKELFSGTLVEKLDLTLEDHDRLIAYVLGLSHAINIAFFDALQRSGESASALIKMSSTTFDAQLLVSAAVSRENPNLYYQIQYLNEFGREALNAMCDSAEHVRALVVAGDEHGFVDLMEKGHEYFALRRRPDEENQVDGKRRRRIGD